MSDLALARERRIVLTIAAVQFVNVLDFVMVMPLGPDFARTLEFSTSQHGFIAGSYTAAAAIAGLVGLFFLDRFDRRTAVAITMLGLVVSTALCGFAVGLKSLMAFRFLAGFFGGPATSVALSILADVVPAQRRGKAMGTVIMAFSFATIAGLPAGLELARVGGWQMTFFAVAALGLVVTVLCLRLLPPMREHLATRTRGLGHQAAAVGALLSRPIVRLSLLMTAVVMAGSFAVIPNISAFVQENLGYPRERLGLLYFAGGVVTLFTVRGIGILVDRLGSFAVGTLGSVVLATVLTLGFMLRVGFPVLAFFISFMMGMSLRNVAYNTLATKVPRSEERASFMSIQSSVQHLAMAAGAFAAARILQQGAHHELIHMEWVAAFSLGLTALLPALLWRVEAQVRSAAAAVATAPPLG